MCFNGWFNRETWCVNVWLSNDEHLISHFEDSAKQWIRSAIAKSENRFFAESNLAEEIERVYRNQALDLFEYSDLGTCNVFLDMLNHSLSEVCWIEIAKHIVDENFDRIIAELCEESR